MNIVPEGSTQQSAIQAQDINKKSFKKRTIQQQQQHLLAFAWVDGITDYNIDYAKVKEKKCKAA